MNLIKTLFSLHFLILTTAYAAPSPEALQLINQGYSRQISATKNLASQTPLGCEVSNLAIQGQDPITGEMREVTAQAYEKGRNSADAKTILLLPPTGGENPLDRNMAGFLCGLGFRVVVVRGWKYDDEVSVEDFGFHDRQSIRMAAALRHVVEYINPTRPKQLGVLGTSLGGIRASFLLGIEPRVAAGVLIVAGGGMPEIISSSTEEGLTKLREARMARFSFASVDNYQAELSRHIKIDALDFIGSSGEKNVLMVIAGNDTTVPTQSQLRLHQAFGSQDRIDYSGNHLEAIVAAFSLNGLRFASFFNSNLD